MSDEIKTEPTLIKLFNVACQETKSEFKKLIFFEQIQRYQWEKKYNEDEIRLKEKEKFLSQYFTNIKNEFEENKTSKTEAINELKSYIKSEINKELNNRNYTPNDSNSNNKTSNIVKVENNSHSSNSDTNYSKVLDEMKEIKKNQQELINKVYTLYNINDEIYSDFEKIKKVLSMFSQKFRTFEDKIQNIKSGNLQISDGHSEKNQLQTNIETDNLDNLKSVIRNVDNKLQEFEQANFNKFEAIKVEFKTRDKQLEDKIYEKIRSKQKKEIKEGFDNQEKRIKEGFDNQDKKIKDGFDNQDKKIKERLNNQMTNYNKKINELTDEITKVKNIRNLSEEIKKLSEVVKENKLKEDERINNVTNLLNEKINKVDTDSEFLDKEVKEIKKTNQQFEMNIKDFQEKFNEFESNFKDVSTVTIAVDEACKNLLKQMESTDMNLSIIEADIASLNNEKKNYNLEQMNREIKILNVETKDINKKLLPSIKKDYEKKLADFDTKFLAKIGDVYKSINGCSQRVNTLSGKFDDKVRDFKDIEKNMEDKIRRFHNFYRFPKRQKDDSYDDSDVVQDDINLLSEDLKNFKSSQQKFWTDMNNKIQVFVRQVNDKHKIFSDDIDEIKKNKTEFSSSQEDSQSLKGQIHGIENEIHKLKELVVTSITVPFKANDTNYMTLQNYLLEILQKNWINFEKVWKQEFYKCVEEINKVLNNNKLMTLSPIVINIPD